jgi:NNP family nitrate/nitrite transporter-like MFS transporter
LIGLGLTLLPLSIGWQFASTLPRLYALGLLLGVAGASFAVALPLAGRWFPPQYQGLAMGIAGAGNSGTLMSTLFAPRLAQYFGWRSVFGVALVPVLAVALLFALLARDNPARSAPPRWRDYAGVLREPDTAWFSMLYAVTFGGFVGLASFLTIFFHDQYDLSKVQAGDLTTLAVVAGSFLRPVGGWLADRLGGYRLLLLLLGMVSGCLAVLSTAPVLASAVVLLVCVMAMLGMGNGAVFQLVPQRFPESVGILTGIVGAAGGLGGFIVPSMLGAVKDRTGHFSGGFLAAAAVVFAVAVILLQLGSRWQTSWRADSARRAGIFCYRKVLAGTSEEAA